jgi:hypothetical protein
MGDAPEQALLEHESPVNGSAARLRQAADLAGAAAMA